MLEEEKYEEKVEVKEKPLGGTKVMEEIELEVSEQPSTTAQIGRAENAASKGGEAVGRAKKKIARVLEDFTAGVSRELKANVPPMQREQEAQQTEYRSELTREPPKN